MHALMDLLTTDYGLMSLAVIVFTLVMGAFFSRYFARHMREDCARADREQALAQAAAQAKPSPAALGP